LRKLLFACLFMSSVCITTTHLKAADYESSSGSGIDYSTLIHFKVEKYTLKNGMTVLLHEDHSVPMVSFHTWFRVGSKDEKKGETGIAHLLEHMMFKGSKNYKEGEYDSHLRKVGGSNNAFTSRDYTGYYINIPSPHIELAMRLESDRMANLDLNEDKFKRELEVVKEERRFRVDNSVLGKMNEVLFNTSYRVHPYKNPVVGWMKDLESMSVKKLRAFYTQYYAPNNAVLVVVGDFDSDQVKKMIKRHYEHIPSQKIDGTKYEAEPKQKGQRMRTITKNVQNAYLNVAFHISKAAEDDSYALDLLANILGEGDSSWMHKRLVYKEQRASSVSVYSYTPKEPGLFRITVSLKPGADMAAVTKGVYGILWRARNQLFDEKEVQKARNQIMYDYVSALKTLDGKARALAINEILLGDYKYLFSDLVQYSKVTPKRIKEVAEKYLQPHMRTVVQVRPRKL
jgi:zinc protease